MAKKNADRYIFVNKGNSTLAVDTVGAQIVSWKVDGLEVMYGGALGSQFVNSTNPEPRWAATAKVLFPNPGPMGKTNSKFGKPIMDENGNFTGEYELPTEGKTTTYYHNGGKYQMGQHGFAQSEEYKVLSKVEFDDKTGRYTAADDSLVMTISDELNDTSSKFPYKFAHSVVYGLDNQTSLSFEGHAQNNDNKPMIGGQGWHPAFKLHGNPENYVVRVENLKKKEGCELQEGQIIKINDEVISQDKSVHYGGIAEADIVLYYLTPSGKTIKYLTMHTIEPELILWSRKALKEGQENFIAIEPWNTPSRIVSNLTTQDKTPELAKKGAVIVEPALSAEEKQNLVDKAEQEQGTLSEYQRLQLRENLQREDSVLSATIKVNPEYIKQFAPTSTAEQEMGPGAGE